MSNILCIGAGYVGRPTMAVIAKYCPQHQINVVDINPDRIAAWNSDDLPIYEPGLSEVVREARDRNLFSYTAEDIAEQINCATIIFVSVNTLKIIFGLCAGRAAENHYWKKTAQQNAVSKGEIL